MEQGMKKTFIVYPGHPELVEHIEEALKDWGYPTMLRALGYIVEADIARASDAGNATDAQLFRALQKRLDALADWADAQGL
jgi:hypothetical protein